MKEIHEKSRSVLVMAETDVLVVGSGPAGLSAALSIKDDVTCRQVDRGRLQSALQKSGVRIN